MKKFLLALGCAVVLGGAGCGAIPPSDTVPQETTPTTTLENVQTYRNIEYKFEFKYPAGFGFATPNYATLENKLVQVQYGDGADAYPGTNFRDAGLAVSTVYATDEAQCLNGWKPTLPTDSFKEKRVINGITFYFASSSEGATGNLYESRYFRTYHGSQCTEVAEVIHTTNVGNYPNGTVKEVDRAPVWQTLDSILATFTFNS